MSRKRSSCVKLWRLKLVELEECYQLLSHLLLALSEIQLNFPVIDFKLQQPYHCQSSCLSGKFLARMST